MNAKVLVAVAAAFLGGALLAWFLKPAPSAPVPEESAPRAHRGSIKEPPSAAELARLGKRVRELEAQLAAARAQPPPADPAARTNDAARAGNPGEFRPPRGPEGFRRHMEEMAKNDPARYAQMTNHMAQWRSRRIQQAQDRIDFLSSLDVSHMTKQQRDNHEKLQELLARREELMEMGRPDGDATDEQRQKAFQEMHQINRELRQLESAERDMLLDQAASNLGLKGDDAADLVSTVKTIYEATQSRGPGGPGGPRGPR